MVGKGADSGSKALVHQRLTVLGDSEPQGGVDELTALWQSGRPGEGQLVFSPTACDPPFTYLL